MKAGAFSDSAVSGLSQKFVPIYVDLTDPRNVVTSKVAKEYGVEGIPDVRFLKPDGSPIARLHERGADAVARQMQAVIEASN